MFSCIWAVIREVSFVTRHQMCWEGRAGHAFSSVTSATWKLSEEPVVSHRSTSWLFVPLQLTLDKWCSDSWVLYVSFCALYLKYSPWNRHTKKQSSLSVDDFHHPHWEWDHWGYIYSSCLLCHVYTECTVSYRQSNSQRVTCVVFYKALYLMILLFTVQWVLKLTTMSKHLFLNLTQEWLCTGIMTQVLWSNSLQNL